MSAQRYEHVEYDSGNSAMETHPQGDWVEWNEYETLQDKYESLVSQIADLWRSI